jgi:hypothetical protein
MKSKGRKPIPVKIVHDGPIAESYKPKDSMHLSVRQIANGYIVNRHGYKNGKHYDTEHYTTKAPQIDVPRAPARAPARSHGVTSRTKL